MKTIEIVDTTLRDAHQCLWATRMTTAMMTPILGAIDRAGYAFINILGGAVFDVCVRYLHENPWERIGLLCERLATPCDGLTRAQSLYTFELFPDDIVALNALYRPGPMRFIKDYARGKRDPSSIRYIDERLRAITEPTYGIAVYQEQLMRVAQRLAPKGAP